MWIFSDSIDTDFGEDDSSGVRFQPDHFPNVLRPGGGYHRDTIVKSDKPAVFCNKCNDEMVDGSCLRCDWGEKNRAVPVKNYPLDPFADDKAGIRAGSWKFGMARGGPQKAMLEKRENLLNNPKNKEKIVQKFKEIFEQEGRWTYKPEGKTYYVILPEYVASVKTITKEDIGQRLIAEWWNLQPEKGEIEKIRIHPHQRVKNININLLNQPANKNKIVKKFKTIYDQIGSWGYPTLLNEYVNAVHQIEGLENVASNTIKTWWKDQLEKSTIENNRGNKKRTEADQQLRLLSMPKNKNKIVKKFKTIYDQIGSWSTPGRRDAQMDIRYLNAVHEIKELQSVSRNLIKTWWSSEEQNSEKLQIEGLNKLQKIEEIGPDIRAAQNEYIEKIKLGENLEKFDIGPWLEKIGLDPNASNDKKIIRNFMDDLEGWDHNWTLLHSDYDPTRPGYVYAFQYGGTIVIGVTNRWEGEKGRMDQYQIVHRRKIDGTEYILNPTDFSKTDIQYHTLENGLQIPTKKELKSRGLRPLDAKSTEKTGLISIPQKLRWFTEEKAEYIKGPKGRRFRDRGKRRREQREEEKRSAKGERFIKRNIPSDAHVFGPIGGYIAQNIENAIVKFWFDLNITPALDDQTYTESIEISAEPSKASVNGLDVGPDLTLDFHVFLIQQMIENGGHMDKLSEVLTPEDQQTLDGFFDYDQNKKNAALGVTWDPETESYKWGSELGTALRIEGPVVSVDEEGVPISSERSEGYVPTQRDIFTEKFETEGLADPRNTSDYYNRLDPSWEEISQPEIQHPEVQPEDYGYESGINLNTPFQVDGRTFMIDDYNRYWESYQGQWYRVAKKKNLWDFKTANEWEGF